MNLPVIAYVMGGTAQNENQWLMNKALKWIMRHVELISDSGIDLYMPLGEFF